MPESYWKEKLTPEQYKVVHQKGTEHQSAHMRGESLWGA
jgi:hypothetical protein